MEETIIRPIARYYGDLGEKFGVPRQAGVVEELEGRVVVEPAYRDPDALRGIEGFDRLWLIWQFSENLQKEFRIRVDIPNRNLLLDKICHLGIC